MKKQNTHESRPKSPKPGDTWMVGDQIYTIREDGNLDIATLNEEPTLTQQQYKDSCDVNLTLKRHREADINRWMRSPVNPEGGSYMDLTTMPDYQQSLDIVLQANAAFNALPAEVRREFRNDPYEMISFLSDKKNTPRARELGLLTPEEIKKEDPVLNEMKSLTKILSEKNKS